MRPQRRWTIRPLDMQRARRLARRLDIPERLAEVLEARGLGDQDAAVRFLRPSLHDLTSPARMKGMGRAVDRIVAALRRGERITVWGDYDVDGVTSVAQLLLFLGELGFDAGHYIPSRVKEGYGLNTEALNRLAGQGTKLLVAVDCGISNHEQIDVATKAGMDVIVIDHHQVPPRLPNAVAVLDPHQPECDFPNTDACAAGVTFYLLGGLRARLRELGWFSDRDEPNLKKYLDLVALGTVADMVPLTGENRILVHFGLKELQKSKRPGIAALREKAGLGEHPIGTGQVAFRLAPRLNAAGRLGRADRALELLVTDSYSRALELAEELDRTNDERQALEMRILDEAMRQAERRVEMGDRALVLWSDEWHVGVIGIVASRLVEKYGRPVVLVAMEGDSGKGSARSIDGVHIYEALKGCSASLRQYGGHRAAGGLVVDRNNLEQFRSDFIRQVVDQQGRGESPELMLDGEAVPSLWDLDSVRSLEALQPHGLGNPEPVFLARNLEVRQARTVGRGTVEHLKLVVADSRSTYDAIAFAMGYRLAQARGRIDVAYTPSVNEWEGGLSIQLVVKDFRPAEAR
ncbi:MAG: single-stranded-DNA-specific exonuclease RecJ [Deltaproteobacteria bacterium]|nr:MAG: single-stranded-DNA-specific exonuclease RecJ [Deltaproteobacteria bacterium]